MIPRVLHAWWGGPELPAEGRSHLAAWQEMHPDVRVLPREMVYPAHWSDWQAAYADDAEYGDAFTVHEWWNKQRTEGVAV